MHGVLQVRVVSCWIDKLLLDSRSSTNLMYLILQNAWIGQLNFSNPNLKSARLVSGGLLSIRCPTADQPNPFRGPVMIGRKFYLPGRDGEYKGQALEHLDWSSPRMHLAAVGNLAAAGRALSVLSHRRDPHDNIP